MAVKVSVNMSGLEASKFQMAKNFRNMARATLAKECRRYFDMANKRIKRLESSGVLSPALHAVQSSGGAFHAKGKDLKELQHEYARCINFLNMGTSTVKDARKYETKLANKLGGHKLSEAQRKLLFTAFRTIEKASPGGLQAYGSDRLIQYLADEIDSEDENIMQGVGSQDWEQMIEKVIQEVQAEYEKTALEFYNKFRDIFTI